MSEMQVTLANGTTLGFVQMIRLAERIEEAGKDRSHWHLNDCKCCVTVHTPAGAYVIGPNGGEDFFPGQHCGCPDGTTGQTDVGGEA